MLEPVLDFFTRHYAPILFYGLIILGLYYFRHKLKWEGKFVALYKTKFGIKFMQKMADNFPKTVRGLGYAGIPVGFLAMIAIMVFLIYKVGELFFVPDPQQIVGMVLPGVHVPGITIAIPLITGWLALTIVIFIHEFSHGVVSKAHKVPIKSSGFAFIGPILAAFVEPDPKKIEKASSGVKLSIFAAGPWSNILSTFVFGALFLLVGVLGSGLYIPSGVEIVGVNPGSPAELAGLVPGSVIVEAQGTPVLEASEFIATIGEPGPGDELRLLDSEGAEYVAIADENGKIGINLGNALSLKYDTPFGAALLVALRWFVELLGWITILSLALGLGNLLPVIITDGGQMTKEVFTKYMNEKTGLFLWRKLNTFTFLVLILALLLPLFL